MTTRGDGSFEIDAVPASGEVQLGFEGESVLTTIRPLAELLEATPGALRVVLPLRMNLRVIAESVDGAERVAILDADGAELPIRLVQGGRRTIVERARLVDGRSEVLTVSDAAVTAVLYAGEKMLRRAPLRLVPGRVHEVRF